MTENTKTARAQKIIIEFASIAHEKWREGWISQNNGVSVPRIKLNSDGTEGDINLPFSEIHPDWQKENLSAGEAAWVAYNLYPLDEELGSEYIHNEWMKRNPKKEYNEHLHCDYKFLPEDEKEKDRVQYRIMKQLERDTEI
jgi:hypothetical protein